MSIRSDTLRLALGGADNPRCLVVGLGVTGLSLVEYLVARGAAVTVTDSRAQPPGLASLRARYPQVTAWVGGFAATAFEAADRILISPGVSLREPLVRRALARGVPVEGDIELFARVADAPVVAITGSNGKSTVTQWVGEMVAAAGWDVRVGGNLGEPALALLGASPPDLYVLELSSFQLETLHSLTPAVATVLNVSADHLDRYDTLAHYAAAKARIYRQARRCVVNLDDPAVAAMPRRGAVSTFAMRAPGADCRLADRDGRCWLWLRDDPVAPLSSIRLPGAHNHAYALAAVALADAVGIPVEAMRRALAEFGGLPHRMEVVGVAADVCWYNDSKGTNVGATAAAILGLSRPLIWIAGGDGKGADFTALGAVAGGRARHAILLGRDAPRLAAALPATVTVTRAVTLKDAVLATQRLAAPGDAVLFSPACASFDMFRDYTKQNDRFRELVRGAALCAR